MLVNFYQPNDITLIDRGLYDSKFWGKFFLEKGACSQEQYNTYMATYEHLCFNSDLVIALTTCPTEAIRRRGGEGRIVTLPFVEKYNRCFLDFYQSLMFPRFLLIPLESLRNK